MWGATCLISAVGVNPTADGARALHMRGVCCRVCARFDMCGVCERERVCDGVVWRDT